MEECMKPIGMLDSGVGGLTVAREVTRILPEEEIIYYGDTLHLPYGPRLLDEVKKFVHHIINFFLEEKKVKAVVLACNTATSAALNEVEDEYDIPFFGTIKSVTSRAYKMSEKKRIGVIGTEGTVNSQAYQKSLLDIDAELKVFSAACPGFVDLVERGIFSGPEAEKMAHKYLDGLRESDIDVLILGCTHFPYLIPVLQKVMGEDVSLLSSGEAMAQQIRTVFKKEKLLHPDNHKSEISQQEFIVSDKSRISRTFLEKGRKYLKLPALEFKEYNIFNQDKQKTV
ncbi:MAG: glutamate racemase [Halanaerobiaceae bacterium]